MASIVIAAGGTGGHIYPAMAVASELAVMAADSPLVFIGTANGLESRIVPAGGWTFEPVPASPWRRSRPWTLASATFSAIVGAISAGKILRNRDAGVVFSTGGYASAPVLLAAAVSRVPIVLHEPNAQPGVVTRMFGRVASRVTVVSGEAGMRFPSRSTEVTGVAVRRSLFTVGREEARKKLGLPDGFVLLVLGGSQGAGAINSALESALPRLSGMKGKLSVIWACGKRDFDRARAVAESAPINVAPFSYIEDMGTVLMACDAVLGRAGASATAEILVAGLPSLLVPYPFAADDHQRRNAESLERAGAAKVLPEEKLTGESLAHEVVALAGDPALVARMASSARTAGRPEAARAVAAAVLSAMKGVVKC